MLTVTININGSPNNVGVLSVHRKDALRRGKDVYKYVARYTDSNRPDKSFAITFKSKYSRGLLDVIYQAIGSLTARYPELLDPRPGVPKNKVRCRKCRTTLWSRERHEYVTCKCGAVSLDGGYDYTRVTGHAKDIINLTKEK